MELLVIGLDGAPYHLLDDMRQRMPCLDGLMENGSYGLLKSTIPALSLLAWPVFYTGKNPGKIGVYVTKLMRESVDEIRLPTSHDVKAPAVWEILSRAKRKVGVVNVPVTYPPKPVNGFMITGFLTPPSSRNYTYPEELKDELADYVVDLDILTEEKKMPERDLDKSSLLREQYNITEKRARTCLRMIHKYAPDFFIVNFKGLDNVQHLFWDTPQIIFEFYQRLNSIMKQLIDEAKPTYTMVMSDHGFQPRSTKYFHINSFLEREGFLFRNRSLKGRFSIFSYNFGVYVVERFPFLRNLIPERTKSSVAIGQMRDRIDWGRTLAYADWHRGIFVSKELAGSDYREIAAAIIEKMKGIKDPETGELVFRAVKMKEELFSGPYFDLLPDIVWLPSTQYRINANLYPRLISPRLDAPHVSGEHMTDPDGIFTLTGPGILRNKEIRGAQIADLTPTILYLMDLPIPGDMDGRVLEDAFEPSRKKATYEESGEEEEKKFEFSEEDAKKIEERLKGLGYL